MINQMVMDADRIKSNFSTKPHRKIVCVQGLGFVGTAMAVAVAGSRKSNGASSEPIYNVVGVELPHKDGLHKVSCINQGVLPFETQDDYFISQVKHCFDTGNLFATTDSNVYGFADVVVVDIHCDVVFKDGKGVDFNIGGLKESISQLGATMKVDSLIVVETTVPPGTCQHVLLPLLQQQLKKRGLASDDIHLAHSYERVTPGKNYLKSITEFFRVFSGVDEKSANACESFLSSVINVKDFPLTRLSNTTASETSKVLENSYRAVNIAFMEEWGRFSESVGIDIYEIINAIKLRPTHNNIMRPGFAVGGYCLTKDPLFAQLASRLIFKNEINFDFSERAVEKNQNMPLVTLNLLEKELGTLTSKKILLLGVSYLANVGDTRYSGSELFYREGVKRGAVITPHDPMVSYWPELDLKVITDSIPSFENFDAVVFAVSHSVYTQISFNASLTKKPFLFDANFVLSNMQISQIKTNGYNFKSIGRG